MKKPNPTQQVKLNSINIFMGYGDTKDLAIGRLIHGITDPVAKSRLRKELNEICDEFGIQPYKIKRHKPEKRTEKVQARLTKSEMASLVEVANEEKVTVSELIRIKITNK